jgi:DNA-binding winged helix-turn-helix (wHTH) protein/Tol biopolymer transport system component
MMFFHRPSVNWTSAGICLTSQLPSRQTLAGTCDEIGALKRSGDTLLATSWGRRGVKETSNGSSRLRFGQLELDLSKQKLLRKGLPVRLANQPWLILAILLEHPGSLVSREELCARLWPDGTYVDFDEGLNSAVKNLRYALGDVADNPTFIETIPRRGYRFIAPVQIVAVDSDASLPLEPTVPGDADEPTPTAQLLRLALPTAPHSKLLWRAAGLIAFGVFVAAALWVLHRLAFPPMLQVTQIVRLTNSARLEPWGNLASDGSRLFFLEREGDHWNTRQISVTGGESVPFGSSTGNTKIFAVSRDQSDVLFAPFTMRGNDLPLWSMPVVGGAPTRVGAVLATSATFSPDGRRIAFTNSNGVFLANRDGSDPFKLAPSLAWAIDWSPDGEVLRFCANGPGPGTHLWQVDSTGRNLHPFLPSWDASDGRWTFDGSYYIFNSREALWGVRASSFPWLQPTPTQLTFPPIRYSCHLPSREGHLLYACGSLSEPIDMVQFDPVSHQSKPVSATAPVTEAVASPDGQWMLFSSWHRLWRSRPNGSDRVQLADTSSAVALKYLAVRWSPDSKHILFHSLSEDNKGTIYLISSAGGTPQQPLPAGQFSSWPDWSPDGRSFSYSVEESDRSVTSELGVYLFDLDQGRSTLIPGSVGLTQARWSPDGRFLAAVSEDTSAIKLLDLRTHHWSEVARGTLISFPVWSSDSILYFQDILAPGEPVYRFQPRGAGPRRAYSFEDMLQAGALRCGFWGFAPDGSLLVQVNRGGGDLYALSVNLP